MEELGIIADDLTGACDAAACFAERADPVRVFVDPGSIDPALLATASIPSVINTQSRLLRSKESRERCRTVAALLADRRIIFKKIDAALRGPVGAELKGLATALPNWKIVVAPAFPAIQRTTEGGRQYDRGMPISRTEYAGDPAWPITTSDVRAILSRTGNVRCVIRDARTDEDLRRIVREELSENRVIFAGSIGLADALSHWIMEKRGSPPTARGRQRGNPAKRIIVICGSGYERSAVQLARAVETLKVGARTMTPDDGFPELRSGGIENDTVSVLMIRIVWEEKGASETEIEKRLARLAETFRGGIASYGPEAIGIIGGETAYRILSGLGTRSLLVHGRTAEVVSHGILENGILQGVRFAMKGGSVGSEDAVVSMVDLLTTGEARDS